MFSRQQTCKLGRLPARPRRILECSRSRHRSAGLAVGGNYLTADISTRVDYLLHEFGVARQDGSIDRTAAAAISPLRSNNSSPSALDESLALIGKLAEIDRRISLIEKANDVRTIS